MQLNLPHFLNQPFFRRPNVNNFICSPRIGSILKLISRGSHEKSLNKFFRFSIITGVIGFTALSNAQAQSCSSYNEAPMLASAVASGALPAVGDRVEEPLVVEVAEQIGVYGGTMVDTTGGTVY